MYILPYIRQPATLPSRPQISTSPAPSTTGQPCQARRTDGTSTPEDSPRGQQRKRRIERRPEGEHTPEAAQTAQRRTDGQRNRQHHQRHRLDYCPDRTASQTAPEDSPSTHASRGERETGDGNRERERGRRGEGSEGKTAVKAPPFDHLPDWRHQPSPGHPMTARGHQTAPDGHTAEGEHPAPVLLLWSMQNQP